MRTTALPHAGGGGAIARQTMLLGARRPIWHDRRMRRPLLLVATATMLLLAACSDDGESSPTTAATSATTEAPATTESTDAPSTTDESGPSSTTSGGGDLEDALLTADDVGEGFVATPGDPGDPDDLTPCGTPGVEQVVPSLDEASVDLSNDEANLFLSHQVLAYEESGVAEEAMAAGREGLACGSGTSTEADGSTTEFELAEVEVPEGLAEEVFAFSGTVTTGGQTVDATFVALRQGSAISTMTFISASDSTGPPIEPVLQIAADKLAAVG